ncbi:NAD(P)H-hydrate epimerase [Deinococcus peraridilitoris]|uniref:NAD(P)H-hydrate epimerase n=1 Tax=Deinococcus peraridilitoris TaxID=432329 RepID=UPI0009FCD66D
MAFGRGLPVERALFSTPGVAGHGQQLHGLLSSDVSFGAFGGFIVRAAAGFSGPSRHDRADARGGPLSSTATRSTAPADDGNAGRSLAELTLRELGECFDRVCVLVLAGGGRNGGGGLCVARHLQTG